MLWLRFSIAPFSLRVNDYLEAKSEHGLVDPDVNFLYTRRKRRLLGLEDALDPNTPNSSVPSDNTKKRAFPTDGWGTALAKVHYLPVQKWTDILRIQEKSTKTANITRCLQDFKKPSLFWLMNTFTRSRLTKIKAIFIIAEVLLQGQKTYYM